MSHHRTEDAALKAHRLLLLVNLRKTAGSLSRKAAEMFNASTALLSEVKVMEENIRALEVLLEEPS